MEHSKFGKLMALYSNVGKLITASVEFAPILSGIMQEVRLYFNPRNWSMLRYDQLTEKLYFALVEGEDPGNYQQFRLGLGEGIAGYVAKHREAVIVNDAYSDPRFLPEVDKLTGFKTNSIIAVPCMTREKLYGVFELVNHDGLEQFTEDDLLVLQSIADFAAIAFANAETYEHAVLQSKKDPLTGLWNHSKLSEIVSGYREGSGHQRRADRDRQLIVVYIDVNNFKHINDCYGHSEGDLVLKKMAAQLSGVFRREDVLIRSGGDEFVAIVEAGTDASTDASAGLAEILRERLAKISFADNLRDYTARISYGIAVGGQGKILALINEADERMYKMKSSTE